MSQRTTIITLLLVLVILLGAVLGYLYVRLFDRETQEFYALEEIREREQESADTFYSDREYEAAIAEQKTVVAEADLSYAAEVEQLFTLAGMYVRDEHEKSVEIYKDIYHNTQTDDRTRAKVLRNLGWFLGSSFEERGIDIDYVRDNVFTDEAFGVVLPDGFVLENRLQYMQAISYMFEYSLLLDDDPERQYLSYVLSAYYLPARFEFDFVNPDQVIVDQMKLALEVAAPYTKAAAEQSLADNEYSSVVGAALYYSNVRTNLRLVYLGQIEPEVFRTGIDDTLTYVTRFKDQHYNASVFAAESTIYDAIGNSALNDFVHTEAELARIAALFEAHIYTLEPQDLERRGTLRWQGEPEVIYAEYGTNLGNAVALRHHTWVSLAAQIPELKAFLVANVEGWDTANFDVSVWDSYTLTELQ